MLLGGDGLTTRPLTPNRHGLSPGDLQRRPHRHRRTARMPEHSRHALARAEGDSLVALHVQIAVERAVPAREREEGHGGGLAGFVGPRAAKPPEPVAGSEISAGSPQVTVGLKFCKLSRRVVDHPHLQDVQLDLRVELERLPEDVQRRRLRRRDVRHALEFAVGARTRASSGSSPLSVASTSPSFR